MGHTKQAAGQIRPVDQSLLTLALWYMVIGELSLRNEKSLIHEFILPYMSNAYSLSES